MTRRALYGPFGEDRPANGTLGAQARLDLSRGDVEQLPDVTSEYGRLRAADPKLSDLRFPTYPQTATRKPGRNVTQLHYARRGMVTPEMEFIAIVRISRVRSPRELASRNGHGGGVARHPDRPGARTFPTSITPEFVRDEVARGRAIIPEHQPSRNRADDHRPQFPGEDQFEHRKLGRQLLH